MASKDESPSVAVERALAMLEAVAQEPEGLSNADISRKLQIPKSSASYILRTLEKQAYFEGRLAGVAPGKVRVELQGKQAKVVEIPLDAIRKANLVVEF